MRLLRLIASRMRQRGFVVEHLREIGHVKPSAEGFAFEKKLGFAQRRAASLLADDLSARNRRRHCKLVVMSCLRSI